MKSLQFLAEGKITLVYYLAESALNELLKQSCIVRTVINPSTDSF